MAVHPSDVIDDETREEMRATVELRRQQEARERLLQGQGDAPEYFSIILGAGSGAKPEILGKLSESIEKTPATVATALAHINNTSGFRHPNGEMVRFSDAQLATATHLVTALSLHEMHSMAGNQSPAYLIEQGVSTITNAAGEGLSALGAAAEGAMEGYENAPNSPDGASTGEIASNTGRAVAAGVNQGFDAAGAALDGAGERIEGDVDTKMRERFATRLFELLGSGTGAEMNRLTEALSAGHKLHPEAEKYLAEHAPELLATIKEDTAKTFANAPNTMPEGSASLASVVHLIRAEVPAVASAAFHLTGTVPTNPPGMQRTQIALDLESFQEHSLVGMMSQGNYHLHEQTVQMFAERGLIVTSRTATAPDFPRVEGGDTVTAAESFSPSLHGARPADIALQR